MTPPLLHVVGKAIFNPIGLAVHAFSALVAVGAFVWNRQRRSDASGIGRQESSLTGGELELDQD
jgi:hypothetical protein